MKKGHNHQPKIRHQSPREGTGGSSSEHVQERKATKVTAKINTSAQIMNNFLVLVISDTDTVFLRLLNLPSSPIKLFISGIAIWTQWRIPLKYERLEWFYNPMNLKATWINWTRTCQELGALEMGTIKKMDPHHHQNPCPNHIGTIKKKKGCLNYLYSSKCTRNV